MAPPMRSSLISARALLAAAGSLVCLFMVAAPVLAAYGHDTAAAILYCLFSPICHQIPDRSFVFFGHAWAACHRCAGIYLGLLLAAAVEFPWIRLRPQSRRFGVLAGILPLLLDALLPFAGLWQSTCAARFVTGLIFGVVAASLLVLGVAELLREAPRRRFGFSALHFKGGLS